MRDFCIFILTHGRPDRVVTLSALRRCGYTGPWFLICDNEDKQLGKYQEQYGDRVIVFDKKAVADRIDEGDNFGDRRAIIYARNAAFDIARERGFRYFMQLDDDYSQFQYRIDYEEKYRYKQIMNLNRVLKIMLKFYKSIPALSLCMAQGGDFLGGINNASLRDGCVPKRKAMNTFLCSTDRPFPFFGRINEDVNTYAGLGARGGLFLTVLNIAIVQLATQHNPGGMSEMYLDAGTYVKSFYTVMYNPSCVKIGTVGNVNRRLHHKIYWANAVPVILSEKYRKR